MEVRGVGRVAAAVGLDAVGRETRVTAGRTGGMGVVVDAAEATGVV